MLPFLDCNSFYSLLMLSTGFSLAMRHALMTTHSTMSTNTPKAKPMKYIGFIANVSANRYNHVFPTIQAMIVPITTEGMDTYRISTESRRRMSDASPPFTLRMAISLLRRWVFYIAYQTDKDNEKDES